MDKYPVGGLELTRQTYPSLGSMAMATCLTDVDSVGDPTSPVVCTSRNSPVEDDDVVFIESLQPQLCAPVASERNFVFTSSKHEKSQGNYYSIILPSRDLTSQKGNICGTIVIHDDEDIETNGEKEKNLTNITEWGPSGNKNSPKDLDFITSSLSRSKTKTGVGPFNPGRMNEADVLRMEDLQLIPVLVSSERFLDFPVSIISRNHKQPGVNSLSPVASQNFQLSTQHLTKPARITCANCKNPLQKGQTAYQRKGSAHLFCSTTCLSSFSHKCPRKTRNVTCKKDAPPKKATVSSVESNKSLQEFCSTSFSPYEDYQNLRKGVFNKSRCTMCSKLGEVRHEISVNNITHKLCSNHCFNEYRSTNGLIMNCCEQCGEYMPNKNTGNNVLIRGQQKRFCCQNCVNEYNEIMETKSKTSALENRKRNAIREENERKLPSSTLSEKLEEIPEKKEKIFEIKVSAKCSPDILLNKQNVNLLSMPAVADKFQGQLEDKNSEDYGMSVVLSSDPGTWPQILNIKQRDTLVENDPPQVRNFNFPKDNTGRKFSETYYTRVLPSGEKATRSWLLYSASKDSVFCLYCKLFGEGKNQLKNENGCKDWQHLSHILSKHEESEMHISNSVKYSKLKSGLKNKTDEAIEHKLYEGEENGLLLLYT